MMIPPTRDCHGCLQRLQGIRWGRLVAGFHGAESTPPGTGVAEEHDRRGRNAIPFSTGPATSIPTLTIIVNSSKRNETKIPQLKYRTHTTT
jgi:hypothetical protein